MDHANIANSIESLAPLVNGLTSNNAGFHRKNNEVTRAEVLLMVQNSANHLGCLEPVANNGINYVSTGLPDFRHQQYEGPLFSSLQNRHWPQVVGVPHWRVIISCRIALAFRHLILSLWHSHRHKKNIFSYRHELFQRDNTSENAKNLLDIKQKQCINIFRRSS